MANITYILVGVEFVVKEFVRGSMPYLFLPSSGNDQAERALLCSGLNGTLNFPYLCRRVMSAMGCLAGYILGALLAIVLL